MAPADTPRLRAIPQVALLNFYLLLHAALYAYWNIVSRDRGARAHFFTVRDLFAERELCDRILSMLLPESIMAHYRAPSASSSVGGRPELHIDDDGEIVGAELVGVVSAGEERFAEHFPDASVMFAMGEWGARARGADFRPSFRHFV